MLLMVYPCPVFADKEAGYPSGALLVLNLVKHDSCFAHKGLTRVEMNGSEKASLANIIFM
jgi:hypothetical protein